MYTTWNEICLYRKLQFHNCLKNTTPIGIWINNGKKLPQEGKKQKR